ncbi:MAG: RnfABCDGE type electron transport complex subunit D [Clostridia bacterium]|nr:RnfABCDGE type electron transport complex subunit D [Clostridia bacterium]
MEDQKFIVSSSPHIATDVTVNKIMYSVIAALIPTVISGIYYFGIYSVWMILASILACVLTEFVFQKLRNKPLTIDDGSAVVTGLLLALTLPPRLPLWMVILGAVVAIGLGKQVFGGVGCNPFNPALVGRAFLIISFPVHMTTWINPVDGVTSATPLNLLKMEGATTSYIDLFTGNIGGSIGETSVIAIILGGIYLIYKGYADWRIPVGYLASVAILSLIIGQDPIFHLLAGGLLFGAFFMATDMVTTPVTKIGRFVFGIGAGVLVVIIRVYGGYPEGVMFSILLMNGLTPIIDRYTRSRIYGEVRQ